MTYKSILAIICILSSHLSFAQAFLQSPIEGSHGKDWIIVNYVDWATTGIQDHNCGNKCYDGHQGTDFTIRSFKQMDSGVNVLASEAGRVTFIKDGEFDRETISVSSKGLGNYIAIKHINKYYSYYGHLKKNSLLVNVGDSVNAGDVIAQVGSSGNSTDPHLHFELWYDSLYVVDPFAGSCGNPTSLWINPAAYDTSLGIFESGIISKSNLSIDDLRERISSHDEPYVFPPNSDSSLNFWAHMYGVRKGKEMSTVWTSPTNVEWFKFDNTLNRDYWYYYYSSYINHQNLPLGIWNVKLYYDGSEVAAETFEVKSAASISGTQLKQNCDGYESMTIDDLQSNPRINLRIHDLTGKEIHVSREVDFSPGIYLLTIKENNNHCRIRKYIPN